MKAVKGAGKTVGGFVAVPQGDVDHPPAAEQLLPRPGKPATANVLSEGNAAQYPEHLLKMVCGRIRPPRRFLRVDLPA